MELAGWNRYKISDFCKVIRGASPRPKGDKRFYGGSVPRLMVEDVTRDGKNVTPVVDSLTELGATMSRPMRAGSLTVVCSGTVGIPAFLAVDACIHDGFLGLTSFKENVSREFVYYQLEALKKRIDDAATHGGIFTNLTVDGFSNFEIDIPASPREQQAIAEALSDADALIASLEKLIEKKEMIFDSIQEKKLNSSCASNYSEYSLDELAIIDPDNLSANTDPEFYFRYISLEAVSGGQLLSLQPMRFSEAPSRARRKMKEGDVLFGTVRPNLKSHYFNRSNQDDLICSNGFCVIRPNKNIFNGYFLFRHLMSGTFDTQINKIIAGSNYPAVSSGDVRKLRISVPDISLQNEISAELEDFESEIVKLKTQLLKAKKVKAGMMQELLTGRTRLI